MVDKLIILCLCSFLYTKDEIRVYAKTLDYRKWKVVDYVGETWYANHENIIGKTQEFIKGWADGIFFSCQGGRSSTYTSYSVEEFLNNKEFYLFNSIDFKSNKGKIFVHRISCFEENDNKIKVLYPLVSQENSNQIYYLFEGAIYILE